MYKLVVFILAFIVLAGSSIPCCAGDNCQEDFTTSASTNQGSDEKSPCSPFFACGSCAGFVIMTKQVNLPDPTPEMPSHHEKITPFFASAYYFSFFQPPRLS
jgi:hypothetical protein